MILSAKYETSIFVNASYKGFITIKSESQPGADCLDQTSKCCKNAAMKIPFSHYVSFKSEKKWEIVGGACAVG